jgi:hypothetical protein
MSVVSRKPQMIEEPVMVMVRKILMYCKKKYASAIAGSVYDKDIKKCIKFEIKFLEEK